MNRRVTFSRRFALLVTLFSTLILSACANLGSLLPTNVTPSTASPEQTTANSGMVPAAGAQTFVIVPAESIARFTLGEELLGAPKTVVGTTSGVSGELFVDPANPTNTTIGTIQVDANSFVTDNERRNAAIRRFILEATDYPFITFAPTALNGMPAAAAVGDTLSFQVTGDLTIRQITKPVTFDVTVTVASEEEVTGTATAAILRPEFELTIPNVPNVANVTEEVTLELEFVARPQ